MQAGGRVLGQRKSSEDPKHSWKKAGMPHIPEALGDKEECKVFQSLFFVLFVVTGFLSLGIVGTFINSSYTPFIYGVNATFLRALFFLS